MRDLKKDLEICENAEKGPWITGGCSGRMITTPGGYHGDGFLADVDLENNAKFIAESREGWPEAITRALVAERKLEILWEYVSSKECPFPEPDRGFTCKEVGYACLECVHNNIHQKAFAELGLKPGDPHVG